MTSSSDLTGSWVNGRDVCNKLSLSINTVNFKYEKSTTGPVCWCWESKKISRSCNEWEAKVTEEKVVLLSETCAIGLCVKWAVKPVTLLRTGRQSEWMDLISRESNDWTDDMLIRRALIPQHRYISQQPQKHGAPDTTPHPIGKAPASRIVWDWLRHLWCPCMGSC